jgi:hypothetical protein
MFATDYIANNVWHLEEQVKRLRKMAGNLMDEALALERSAGHIQVANRKRLGMGHQHGPQCNDGPCKDQEKPGYDWRCTCGKPFHEGSCSVERDA